MRAFEVFCIKHLDIIKQKLGIAGVYVEHSFWRNDKAQIELQNFNALKLKEERLFTFFGKNFLLLTKNPLGANKKIRVE